MSVEVGTLLVSAVVLGGLCCIGIVLLRRLSQVARRLEQLEEQGIATVATEQRRLTAAVSVLADAAPRFDSPVSRLTFQESLDPARFAAASEASAIAGLGNLLGSRIGDGSELIVQGVRLTQQGAEMIVSVSSSGRKLLSEGKVLFPFHRASGARLPLLIDARTGRVIEQLKEMPVSTITARLASISGAVIGGAHLVAGADLAKRLGRIESKLDLVLASRRIDQVARLERIYVSARELTSRAMDRDRQLEMWRLRGELRELRSAWRQDFRLKLERIDDPTNAGWFQRVFSRQRSIDRRVSSDISEGEAEVALMEYSMRLEHVLAVGSDTLDAFQRSHESELEQLDQLRDLLQQKAGYISGKHPELSPQAVVDAVSTIVEAYRELLPNPADSADRTTDTIEGAPGVLDQTTRTATQ